MQFSNEAAIDRRDPTPVLVKQMRADRKLSYNHYCDMAKLKSLGTDSPGTHQLAFNIDGGGKSMSKKQQENERELLP